MRLLNLSVLTFCLCGTSETEDLNNILFLTLAQYHLQTTYLSSLPSWIYNKCVTRTSLPLFSSSFWLSWATFFSNVCFS